MNSSHLPLGWRIVPSRSRQEFNPKTILSYENIYTGERFSVLPKTSAIVDLPSELFDNHVSLAGEQLVKQQVYQLGCILKDGKTLHARQQTSTYVVPIEELGSESASLVGSALSRKQAVTTDAGHAIISIGATLYSATYQAELLTYSGIIRQIVQNSISQIEIVHGRQVQLLQDVVEQMSFMWHNGSSNAQLHRHWNQAKKEKLDVSLGLGQLDLIQKKLDHSFGKQLIKNATNINTKTKRKRGRRKTMIGSQTKSMMGIINQHVESIDQTTELSQVAAAAFTSEVFQDFHSINVKDQLEIVFQARLQTELITKVKKEYEVLRNLVKTSRKRRLNVGNDLDGYYKEDHGFAENVEEEEEEAAEDVEYLKEELQRAREHLSVTKSEIKSTKEKLKSIQNSTHNLRQAYEKWDGISPMHEYHELSPHIRHEVGYKTTETDRVATQNRKASSSSLSRIISIARRQNLVTYIATGGNGKTQDEDYEMIDEKRKALRRAKVDISRSAQMAELTGFASPSMKKMFMLSLAYEVGGGKSHVNDNGNGNDNDNDNDNGSSKSNNNEMIGANISLLSEFGGVNKDPRFRRMQADRYRVMMNTLNSHRVPTYVLTKFKKILDDHEKAIAKAAHSHQHSVKDISANEHVSDVEKKLEPLQREYESKLRDLSGQHALHPRIVQQLIRTDKEAMQPHLRGALQQVIRVIRAMKRFEPSESKDRNTGDFKERMEHNINLDADWEHDHRLQRIHEKSTARLTKIFEQHCVRANIASLLKTAQHKHHRVVEDLLLRQAHAAEHTKDIVNSRGSRPNDKVFSQKVMEASEHLQSQIAEIQEIHGLSKDLLDDITSSHEIHHIHLMQGDSDQDNENDTFQDF